MQTTVRTSHSSTSDLLTWPELPPPEFAASSHRSRQYSQPSDKIGEVLRGSQLTEEEEQSLIKMKTRPGYKMNEMTGNGIFPASLEGTISEAIDANSNSRTSIRIYKQAPNGVSQISFSTEGSIPPKKPTSLPEVTKQRELSGTLLTEPDSRSKRQISSAKTKELVGNDIFGPAPEVVPRSMAPARTFEVEESKEIGEPFPPKVKISNPAAGQSNVFFSEESVNRTSKKLHGQKFAELTGNNIFMEDGPAVSAEKPLSRAKLREMTGSDIFADGKAETREYLKGSRRPPGGGSSIALV
ncbi:hypothetical protein PIB30_010560 [Stylosanthes scabra]|uniref:DUF4057 domain-containing protein n=1 Tax=Stylosanthes scabra TaxID=79078 RepID=A0ABU6S5D1_9FABA|nr:hypothetical protein [Stylosanthes scabra]